MRSLDDKLGARLDFSDTEELEVKHFFTLQTQYAPDMDLNAQEFHPIGGLVGSLGIKPILVDAKEESPQEYRTFHMIGRVALPPKEHRALFLKLVDAKYDVTAQSKRMLILALEVYGYLRKRLHPGDQNLPDSLRRVMAKPPRYHDDILFLHNALHLYNTVRARRYGPATKRAVEEYAQEVLANLLSVGDFQHPFCTAVADYRSLVRAAATEEGIRDVDAHLASEARRLFNLWVKA